MGFGINVVKLNYITGALVSLCTDSICLMSEDVLMHIIVFKILMATYCFCNVAHLLPVILYGCEVWSL
jgi:hypothetical protein